MSRGPTATAFALRRGTERFGTFHFSEVDVDRPQRKNSVHSLDLEAHRRYRSVWARAHRASVPIAGP